MMIASDRQIKLSTMTGKLTGFKAINTNTVTNEFCQKMNKTESICGSCYSMAMLQGSRKNCQPAWQNNSEVLSQALLTARQLPVINERYFRFHGHGELINATHYQNLCRIAEHNPATTFALWTKRRNLVKGNKPANLILIYSNPTIDAPWGAGSQAKRFCPWFVNRGAWVAARGSRFLGDGLRPVVGAQFFADWG
jgi:hypothetical protein